MEQVLERTPARGRRRTDPSRTAAAVKTRTRKTSAAKGKPKKLPAAQTPPPVETKAAHQPRIMHRKGSEKGRVSDPKNLKERLIARRQTLNLSQDEVAKQIVFWNNKQSEMKTLSRSAYCMYESGEVTPDLGKIITLGKVLKCAPEWLAFGVGDEPSTTENLIDEVTWDAQEAVFAVKQSWTFDAEWCLTRFDVEPSELSLAMVDDFTPSLKPGDLAVVRKGLEPSAAGGEFVFVQDDEIKVAHVTRPASGDHYRIYSSDRAAHTDAPKADLTFLGKVVGRIGDI